MSRDPDLSHLTVRDSYLERWPETCYGLGEWRRYTDGIWVDVNEQVVRREVQLVAEIAANDGLAIQVTNNLVSSVVGLLKARKFVTDSLFDSNHNIIAFSDCTLDLETEEPGPHNPNNYLTSKLPFPYDPSAHSDAWKTVLEPVEECHDFLQEFAGYCLTTSTDHETALWLYGPPGGGKSTFIEGLNAMLGSRSCALGLGDIDASRFALTTLIGKTLAVSAEQPSEFIRQAHVINSIISGEPIHIDRKHRDPITIVPHAKIIWAMNEVPQVRSTGIFRRVKVVQFPGIPIENRNPRIKEEIKNSGMAVTNWALAGLKRLTQRGSFLVPAEVEEATNYYRDTNDVPKLFLEECCEPNDASRVNASKLYKAYVHWCKENGHRPESATKFGINMERLGARKIPKSHGLIYRAGYRLLEEGEAAAWDVLDSYSNGQQ
jgi:putative DNA primase/helicase